MAKRKTTSTRSSSKTKKRTSKKTSPGRKKTNSKKGFSLFGLEGTKKSAGRKSNSKSINKSDLVDIVSRKTGLTKQDVLSAIDGFTSAVKESCKNDKRVVLAGFGSFKMSRTKGYSKKATPKQKKIFGNDTIRVPAKNKLSFSASKS